MTDNYVDVKAFADNYKAPVDIEAAFYNRATGFGSIPIDDFEHSLSVSHGSPGNKLQSAFDPQQAVNEINSAFEMDNNNAPVPNAPSSGPTPGL